MRPDTYYLIRSDEDGISIEEMSAALLLDVISTPGCLMHYGEPPGFCDGVPRQDRGHFVGAGGKWLIIKGHVVVPKPKQVVQTYEIE